MLWLIRNYLHTCNHQVHKQTFGWIENNSLDHEDHRAYEFVSLLSSNHRSVLWPVDHWECSIFVALNLWAHHYDLHACTRHSLFQFSIWLCDEQPENYFIGLKRSANKIFDKLDCKIFSQLCLLSLCSLILPVCDMKMNNFCKKSQTDIVEFIEISTNENEGSGTIDQLQVWNGISRSSWVSSQALGKDMK